MVLSVDSISGGKETSGSHLTQSWHYEAGFNPLILLLQGPRNRNGTLDDASGADTDLWAVNGAHFRGSVEDLEGSPA